MKKIVFTCFIALTNFVLHAQELPPGSIDLSFDPGEGFTIAPSFFAGITGHRW